MLEHIESNDPAASIHQENNPEPQTKKNGSAASYGPWSRKMPSIQSCLAIYLHSPDALSTLS